MRQGLRVGPVGVAQGRVGPARVGLMAALLVLGVGCGAEDGDAPPAEPGPDTAATPSAGPGDTAAPAAGADVDPADWVGMTHPPVPEGLEKLAGAVAAGPGESAAEARFGFQHLRIGDRRFVWLSVLEGRDASGEPSWRVVDVLEVPVPEPDERLLIHGCETDDRTALVALVLRAEEGAADIRSAWGVDREAERFVSVAPDGVACQGPGLEHPGAPEPPEPGA